MLFGVMLLISCGSVAMDTEPQQQVAPQEEFMEMRENEGSIEDFVLTISVEETSVSQGENFRVTVELRNDSEEDHEITYNFLFWPTIPDWNLLDDLGGIDIDPPEPQSRLFEANSVIRNIGIWGSDVEAWFIGNTLDPGTHVLRFRAMFYLDGVYFEQQPIEIWSNTIVLTVQ